MGCRIGPTRPLRLLGPIESCPEQVTVLQGQMEADLSGLGPILGAGCPATTRTGMSGKARKNYAVTFPGHLIARSWPV